jgi:hypothetical protein
MAAFDRRHLKPFRSRFLGSLRRAGNQEPVLAIAIGLRSGEQSRFATIPGVQPIFRSDTGEHVARRRLREFAEITQQLPSTTPVAYWDAGDVLFQSTLRPLWQLVQSHPGKLLVAREPCGHPDNRAVTLWTETILDPKARYEAEQAVFHRPFLNSGFLAGDATALTRYFRAVTDWYRIPKLGGTLDWGDQLALNVYCHSHPEAWEEVSQSWNYCLWKRRRQAYYQRYDGLYVDAEGLPIHVVHGNAGTLNARPLSRQPA